QTGGASLGLLDDSCDALIDVEVTQGGRTLKSSARVTVGPPAFAPDSFHVRTMEDDLLQALTGPEIVVGVDLTPEQVSNIVRRALETIRLMNVDNINTTASNFLSGGATQAIFPPATATYQNATQIHTELLNGLTGLASPAGSPQRLAAVGILQQIAAKLRRFD